MEEAPKLSIAERAMALFQRFGLRACTMDDVSRELAISKKTLYKFFTNKAELVDGSIRSFFERQMAKMEQVSAESENALDELFRQHQQVMEIVAGNGPSMLFAMKKYYPETYGWLMERRKQMVLERTRANLERGMKEGLYRTDLVSEYAVWYHYAQMVALTEIDWFPEHLLKDRHFYHYGLRSFMLSIVNEKGLAYMAQHPLTELKLN
jgi:AcrR family transcriptional regulator